MPDNGGHDERPIGPDFVEVEMQTSADEWRWVVTETSRYRRSLSAAERAALGQQWEELLAAIQPVLDQDPSAPVVQELAKRWVGLIQAMNGTIVPLSTLLRCGDDTLRQFEQQWPHAKASPWRRAMSLSRKAAGSQLDECRIMDPLS